MRLSLGVDSLVLRRETGSDDLPAVWYQPDVPEVLEEGRVPFRLRDHGHEPLPPLRRVLPLANDLTQRLPIRLLEPPRGPPQQDALPPVTPRALLCPARVERVSEDFLIDRRLHPVVPFAQRTCGCRRGARPPQDPFHHRDVRLPPGVCLDRGLSHCVEHVAPFKDEVLFRVVVLVYALEWGGGPHEPPPTAPFPDDTGGGV